MSLSPEIKRAKLNLSTPDEENVQVQQEVENAAVIGRKTGADDQLLNRILVIPLITDLIFQYIPTPDLLKYSILSKSWNSSTREFLYRFRPCTIKINHHHGARQLTRLTAFLDGRSSNCPYNGIHFICRPTSNFLQEIDNSFPKNAQESEQKNALMCYENNLPKVIIQMKEIYKRIPMKHVEVQFVDDFEDYSILGIRVLFQSLPLKEIIHFTTNIEWLEFRKCLPNHNQKFTNLKSLYFRNYLVKQFHAGSHNHIHTGESSIQFRFKRFPSLKEWRNSVSSCKLGEFIEANQARLVKSLKICYDRHLPDMVNMVTGLTLQSFDVSDIYCFKDHNLPQYETSVDSIAKILKLNQKTLQLVVVNPNILESIVEDGGVSPLINVRRLEVLFFRKLTCKEEELKWIFPNAEIVYNDYICLRSLFMERVIPTCGHVYYDSQGWI